MSENVTGVLQLVSKLEAENTALKAELVAAKAQVTRFADEYITLLEKYDRIGELTEERGAMAAQLVDAFGDGYYDGFLDGAKHHEAADCSTDPAYLGEEALRCSEIVESEKASRIGISKKQQCLRDVQAEAVEKFLAHFESESYWNKTINDVINEGYQYAAKMRQGGAK